MRTREIKFRVWIPSEKFMGVAFNPFEYISDFEGVGRWTEDSIFMQFTGLLDKNKVEIYEGDIVEVNMGISQGGFWSNGDYEPPREIRYSRTVKWIDEECKLDWDGRHSGSTLCAGNCKYFEVIGNIHQNPELLNPVK